jgi:hypothetical protein
VEVRWVGQERWRMVRDTLRRGCRGHHASNPILFPPKPYLVLRDTLCSCEAYGMRPMHKETNQPLAAINICCMHTFV